jgi:DNA repair ATPase RecN
MVKFEEHHIREAIRIIDAHKDLVTEMAELEDMVKEKKQSLETIKFKIEELKNQRIPDEVKNQKLIGIVVEYEKEVDALNELSEPYLKRYEQLKTSSDRLYAALKEKNPGAADEQLRDYLTEEIKRYMENVKK